MLKRWLIEVGNLMGLKRDASYTRCEEKNLSNIFLIAVRDDASLTKGNYRDQTHKDDYELAYSYYLYALVRFYSMLLSYLVIDC